MSTSRLQWKRICTASVGIATQCSADFSKVALLTPTPIPKRQPRESATFKPRGISLDLHYSTVRFIVNPRIESGIPPQLQARVDSTRNILDETASRESKQK